MKKSIILSSDVYKRNTINRSFENFFISEKSTFAMPTMSKKDRAMKMSSSDSQIEVREGTQ